MGKIGVGIVGLGMAVKPHVLALKELESQVEVVGAFSPSAQRRETFARTYHIPVVGAYEALLEDPRVDALFILTPPRTHAELALRAGRAGKHVLLEKPIDVTYAASKALVREFDAIGRILAVVFQLRFRPAALVMRELLAEEALGKLLSVSASVRWWRSPEYYAEPGRGMLARDGGGVLLTQAIHTLDLMLSLAGPVSSVAAQCRTSVLRSMDTEDIGCGVVRFECGAVGVVDATTAAFPGYPERIDFAGTRGSAVLEAERLTAHIQGKPVREVSGSLAGGGGADPMAFSTEPHRRLIADFIDAVRLGREPVASGRSALAVHGLIDAMLQSSRSGSWQPLPKD
jgi:predicted dehydrogenase